MPHSSRRLSPTLTLAIGALAALLVDQSAQAAPDFSWNRTTTGQTWSLNTNWTPTASVGGPSAAGLFVVIGTNITVGNTINLFNTADAGTATKTVGRLDLGDTDNTNNFTIAAGTGSGVLNFDGNGVNAQLNQLSTGHNDVISAPITISSSLDVAAAGASFVISGGITSVGSSKNLSLNANGAGNLTLQTASVNNSGTITNSGGGAGTTTISGGIGTNVTGINQSSSTSALTISTSAVTLGSNLAVTSTGTALTTISGGVTGAHNLTLNANSSGNFTLSTTSINNGGTVTNSGSSTGTTTISAVIGTNVLGVTENSAGSALVLSGANTYTSGTTLSTGTIVIGVATVGTTSITSSAVGTGLFHLGSGTNSVTLEASSAASTARTLKNSISLDGDVTFAPGPGQVDGRITFDPVTGLTVPNTFTLTRTNQLTTSAGETVDIVGAITGSTFGITKLGAGTLNLGNGSATDANANTYNGLTTVSGGLVNLRKAANTDAIAGDLLINTTGSVATAHNEVINNASSVTVNDAGASLSLGANTETIANLTVGGGSLTGSGGTMIVAGAGTTTVSSGSVSVSNLTTGTSGLTLGSGATVSSTTTLNGNVAFNGSTAGATFGAAIPPTITLNGNRNFTVATGTSGTDLTVSGIVADGSVAGSGITKLGTGTMLLSAPNTYTGTTSVNAGTLLVSNTSGSGTGTGTVSVSAVSGTATLGGIGTIGGNTSIGSNGIITGGTNGGIGTLNFNNVNLAIGTGGTYGVDMDGTLNTTDLLALGSGTLDLSASGDIISFNVAGTLTGASYTLATYGSVTGTFDTVTNLPSGYQLDYTTNPNALLLDQITQVPEPSTWLAGALIAMTLFATQRRRFLKPAAARA